MANTNGQGDMSVRQAGKKGGETTSEKYGREHYQEIGQKGGQKVKRLVKEGEQSEARNQRDNW